MRLIISFILSITIYFLILLFLYFALFKKPTPKQEVLIHTAIITPQIKNFKKSIQNRIKSHPKVVKNTIKKVKKVGSKTNLSTGGKVNFNDIFKNVNYNIPTKKVELKKQAVLSRFRANNILKQLKKIKNINVNIAYNTTSNVKKEKINELIKKIGEVWYEISNIPGEYATINFINKDGHVEVYILDTNLNNEKQNLLINKLQNISFNQNINLTVKFQTKVNK